MAYLLDANVFIQGRKLHYGFDICPGFWEWIDRETATGNVRSIEQVGRELEAGNDELSTWATDRRGSFFLAADAPMLPSLQAVSTWVAGQNYSQAAVSTFLQVADYYLIARAHAHGDVVVTHEVASQAQRKVPIPNVCIGMGVAVHESIRDAARRARAAGARVTATRRELEYTTWLTARN